MSSGQIVGGVIGAVAGYFVPGGGAVMAMKGMSLGMTIGGYLDPPKGPTIIGPRLEDLTVQTSTYGAIIPRVYGTVALCGNIFWIENNALKETVKKSKSGGKGGGSSSTTKTYSYFATFALGLCEGPIVGVRRVWAGSKLIYDAGSNDMGAIIASNSANQYFNLHLGNDTQEADARMQATLGVANTPAYRGLAYLVFKDFPLADYQNSLQGVQIKAEVVKAGTSLHYTPTEKTVPMHLHWSAIAWNGAVFCSIAREANYAIVSPDATNWTLTTLPTTSNYWVDIVWNGKYFVAINARGEGARSPDGVSWSYLTIPQNAVTITNNGRYLVIVCAGLVCATSKNDGASWTIGAFEGVGASWEDVTWNGSIYCAVAGPANGYSCAISKDGLTWRMTNLPSVGSWKTIAWNGSIFCTMRSGSPECAISSDGINWTMQTLPVSNYWNSIIWTGSVFYAIARDIAITSPDGINWTVRSVIVGINCSALGWNGGVIVGVAYGGLRAFTVKPYSVSVADVTLSHIVQTECLLSGSLTTLDIDTDSLTRVVRGYKIASICAIKSSLIQLQGAFPFDVIQSGYKVKFKPRGSSSVVTIPASDLGAVEVK